VNRIDITILNKRKPIAIPTKIAILSIAYWMDKKFSEIDSRFKLMVVKTFLYNANESS